MNAWVVVLFGFPHDSQLSRGKKYPTYLPVLPVPQDPVEVVPAPPADPRITFREQFALWKGMQRGYHAPAGQSRFEKVCSSLFQIEIQRRPGRRRPPILVGDFEALYSQWEDGVVQKTRKLPIQLSQAVYNFSRAHEYSPRGRLGLSIPEDGTRKRYRSEVGEFLLFCRREEQPWSIMEDFADCWVSFMNTPSAAEEKSRIVAIGSFIEHQLEGRYY